MFIKKLLHLREIASKGRNKWLLLSKQKLENSFKEGRKDDIEEWRVGM